MRNPFANLAVLTLGLFCAQFVAAQTPPGGVPIPTASDYGDPYDGFGSLLATDGDWAVASGSFGEAFYVYERLADGSWTRRQRIVPPTLGQAFFRSPHLRGNRLIISRPVDATAVPALSGTVYVYDRTDPFAAFALSATLRPTDSQLGDRFGYGLAQSADRIFVGASGRDEAANLDQGVVYVFKLESGTWSQEARLAPADAGAGDRFGQDLAFDGQDLIVGAQRNRVSATNQGAAYVYRLAAGVWTQAQKLVEPGTSGTANVLFGYQLSASSGQVFVGGRGFNSEYFFTRDNGGVWGSPQRLLNPLAGLTQLFAYVANSEMEGDRMVMHVDSALSYNPFVQGPLFLLSYRLSGGTWTRISRLQLPDEAAGAGDKVVAIATNSVLSAQPSLAASVSSPAQGAILPFALALDGSIGAAQTRIWHGSGNVPDALGGQTAADGDWMLASAPGGDGGGLDRGAVHFFRREASGVWQLSQSVFGTTPTSGACSLALFGDLAVIGRCSEAVGGVAGRGVVQVFKRQPSNEWTALCTLEPIAPSATGFGDYLAMSGGGIWASLRQSGQNNEVEAYPLPTSSCGAGQPLASAVTGGNYFISRAGLSGDRGALSLICFAAGCTGSVQLFDKAGGTWSQSQTIVPSGRPEQLAIDGDRLAVSVSISTGPLDSIGVVQLYERSGGTFSLARTINPIGSSQRIGAFLGLRGDALLLEDISIGSNGGIAVYEFSSGARVQALSVSGLGIEDGFPDNIALGGTDRAILGWPEVDRLGYNNAGSIYTIDFTALRATTAWGIAAVPGAPLPDRLFNNFFENDP